jgi:hypothetical protein
LLLPRETPHRCGETIEFARFGEIVAKFVISRDFFVTSFAGFSKSVPIVVDAL